MENILLDKRKRNVKIVGEEIMSCHVSCVVKVITTCKVSFNYLFYFFNL